VQGTTDIFSPLLHALMRLMHRQPYNKDVWSIAYLDLSKSSTDNHSPSALSEYLTGDSVWLGKVSLGQVWFG